MLAEYSSLHKAYRLIDTKTFRLLYSRDVVFDEKRGPFMPVSLVPDPADQPMKDNDLGVRIPLGPLDGRAPLAPATSIILVIPIQTPSASPTRSPRFVDASPEFDPNSPDEEPDHQASPDTNVGRSPLRPKWWAKTLTDLRDDELIEGRIARKKSKPTKSINFALMANIHSVFEPQKYYEAKGIPEWQQAMTSEHQSLLEEYKIKYKLDGTLDKYKARLVAKGFSQHQGIDYKETFAPTAKINTIRLVLAMATQFSWKVQ